MKLAEKKCQACVTAKESLTRQEFEPLWQELKDWQVVGNQKIVKNFKLKNFEQALALANRIGNLAEAEGHHPDLLVRWGELTVELWTHKVNGLTEADFILAAKIDQLPF